MYLISLTGFLEHDRARFLAHGYNGAYNLNIQEKDITHALEACLIKDSGLVAIDQLLRALSVKGP